MNPKKNKKELILQKKLLKDARRDYLKRLKPLLYAFAVWFFLLTLLHLPYFKNYLRSGMISFTRQSAIVIGDLFSLPMTSTGGNNLSYSGFGMNVILECTAYNFYLFVLVITLFAKWSVRDKLINLGVFLFVIFLANNMRFFVMGILGNYRPELFHTVHDYVWNILFGFLVFIIYYWGDRRAGGVFAPINVKPE